MYFVLRDLCLYMNLNPVIHVLRSQGSLPLHEFKPCNTCTSFSGSLPLHEFKPVIHVIHVFKLRSFSGISAST